MPAWQGVQSAGPPRLGGRGLQCQPRRHNGLQCQGKDFWSAVPGAVGSAPARYSPGGETKAENGQQQWEHPLTATHTPSHPPKGAGRPSVHRAPIPESPWHGDLKPPGCPRARSSILQPRVSCAGGRSRGAGPGQRSLVLPDPPSPAAKQRLLSSPSRSRPPRLRLFLCQRLAPRGSRAGLPRGTSGDCAGRGLPGRVTVTGPGWAAGRTPANAEGVGPSPR